MTGALILAAGFGTRLRPLTLELPKPVVPVGDRPLIAHVASALRRAGVGRLIANAHHEHAKLAKIIDDLSLDIQVIVEGEIRGTAGGVAGAREHFDAGAVLVWNGDILTEPPVEALLQLANERDAQVLAVAPRPAGEGTVGLADDGSVVRLRGQVFGREARGGDYVGVMALGPGVVTALPAQGCLFGDVALPNLAGGHQVWSVPCPAPWTDLGDLDAYVAANFDWLHEQRSGVWQGPLAHLEPGVRVERSILGAGARVLGEGLVRDVIAWPSAVFSAPLSRAVVLRHGRVVPFDAPAKN